MDESLKLLCAGKFVLTVVWFKPSKAGEQHKVHVGLQIDSDSDMGKKIGTQYLSEFDELRKAAAAARVQRARKEDKLKGLE
ncbi:MAG: hypothetical protein O9345_04380 [Burkholderiaceae bacterium]|nr:hypothetical protein [Acidobacteriaceae bacterium]MCZ8098153.1 hypothetical protein [Burkholderiales bacterium]MCZ8337381.1 hypothetical protein [Burkholderiaceae bacterium]